MPVTAGLFNRDRDDYGLYGYAILTDGCLLEGVHRAFFHSNTPKEHVEFAKRFLGTFLRRGFSCTIAYAVSHSRSEHINEWMGSQEQQRSKTRGGGKSRDKKEKIRRKSNCRHYGQHGVRAKRMIHGWSVLSWFWLIPLNFY